MNILNCLPKGVLFDLDDTIISYDGVSNPAWREVCNAFVSEIKVDFTAEELFTTVAKVKHEYWSDPVRHKIGRENILVARREVMEITMNILGFKNLEITHQTADRYTYLHKEKLHLFEGAYQGIANLKNAGIKTALITNGSSDGQREKLERFNLYPLFDEILIDTEVGFSKPDPRIFQLALDRLSLTPKEAVMIGDNPVWDTEIPQNMGIFSVWNNWRGTPPQEKVKADKEVYSVAELSEWIISLRDTKNSI